MIGDDVLVILVTLALLFFAGVGASAFIRGLLDSPDRCRLYQQRRTRQAEQEIIDIGQWEQQAIIAEMLRRTANRQPGTRHRLIPGSSTESGLSDDKTARSLTHCPTEAA